MAEEFSADTFAENRPATTDIHEILYVVLEGKWIILSITAIAMLCSIIYFSSKPNLYTASVQILVEKVDQSPQSYQQMMMPSFRGEEDYYGTQIAILTGRKVGLTVAEELEIVSRDYELDAHRVRGTRILSLSVTHKNPELAATIANKYAEIFIREQSQRETFMSKQILKLIPEKIGEGSAVLESEMAAEGSASQFNKREFAESLSSVTGDPVIQKMRNQKLDIESQLTQLTQRYKPEHPSIRELKDRLVYVETELKERMEKIVNNVRANLAGDIKITNVRVIEEALPPSKPSKPDRKKGVTTHTVIGFIASLAFVIFVEKVNQKVRSEKDLFPGVRLPFLGYVPYAKDFVKTKKGTKSVKGMNYAKSHQEVSYVENLRENTMLSDAVASVRTHILFSMPYEKSRKIMLTSAIPNEGKSTVACLLALSLTTLGRKILLVDADMRKSYLHTYLGVQNGKGLSDLLVGSAKFEEVVQAVSGSTLKIITAGTNSLNPSELLGSEAFKNLLDEALVHYDRVIVDVPPVLYIPDGLIVAKSVHSGVLVCGSGMVTKKIINTVIQKFDAIGHSFIGIVINRANLEKEQYRYSYYGTYKNYYGDTSKGKSKG